MILDRLELADGRRLAWFEFGSPTGRPMVALHGGLVSGLYFSPLSDAAQDLDVRLIAVDRAGYGDSTFNPEQTYQSAAEDIARLADHLGCERFGVLGHSTGGPFAAACAGYLGDRLSGCALVSSGAPPESGLSNADQRLEFRIARKAATTAPGLLAFASQTALQLGRRAPDRVLARLRRTSRACDVAVIERPAVQAGIRSEITRPKAPTAGRAFVQDRRLQGQPWGFRIQDIDLPVHVWHGELDTTVVAEEGVYLAQQIPDATLHLLPDEAHWLLHNHFADITTDIVG